MPRKSEIDFRKLIGVYPKSKLTKAQVKIIEDRDIQPAKVEYYFGKRCAYYKIDDLK